MKRFLVIINGLGGSGKSEFITQCNLCAPHIRKKTMIHECSTVGYVKKIAEICGWTGTKEAKDRVFLSDLKKALEKWNDTPYNKTIEEIYMMWRLMESYECEYGIVFVNSREEKDIKKFYKDAHVYEATPIKLYIDNPRIEVNEVPELIREIKRFADECDYRINNDGSLSQLRTTAAHFMQDILGAEVNI